MKNHITYQNFKQEVGFGHVAKLSFICFCLFLLAGIISMLTNWSGETIFILLLISYPLLVLGKIIKRKYKLNQNQVGIVLTKAEKIKAKLVETQQELQETTLKLDEAKNIGLEVAQDVEVKSNRIKQLESDFSNFKTVLSNQSQEKDKLNLTCKKLKSENVDLTQKVKDLELREADLTKKIEELKTTRGNLTRKEQDLAQQVTELTQTCEDLEAESSELRKIETNLRTKNVELKQSNENLTQTCKDLKHKVSEQTKNLQSAGAYKGKFKEASNKLKIVEHELAELKKQVMPQGA